MEPNRMRHRLRGTNIPTIERAASAIAGAGLAAIGAYRRGLLGGVLAGLGAALLTRGVSGRSAAYRGLAMRAGVDVRRSVLVARPRHEVFLALRDLRRMPRFITPLTSVDEFGGTSHWVAQVGMHQLEWLTDVVEEVPDQRLAWHSVPGGDLEHAGSIQLEDAGEDRTRVTVALRFEPPVGAFAGPLRGLMRLLSRSQLNSDLARLRELLERGELAPRTTSTARKRSTHIAEA